MRRKIYRWVSKWKRQGYSEGIPDEVPAQLMDENLAPSYRQIAIAILKNDHSLNTLGLTSRRSEWYDAIKRVEIRSRRTSP